MRRIFLTNRSTLEISCQNIRYGNYRLESASCDVLISSAISVSSSAISVSSSMDYALEVLKPRKSKPLTKPGRKPH